MSSNRPRRRQVSSWAGRQMGESNGRTRTGRPSNKIKQRQRKKRLMKVGTRLPHHPRHTEPTASHLIVFLSFGPRLRGSLFLRDKTPAALYCAVGSGKADGSGLALGSQFGEGIFQLHGSLREG